MQKNLSNWICGSAKVHYVTHLKLLQRLNDNDMTSSRQFFMLKPSAKKLAFPFFGLSVCVRDEDYEICQLNGHKKIELGILRPSLVIHLRLDVVRNFLSDLLQTQYHLSQKFLGF